VSVKKTKHKNQQTVTPGMATALQAGRVEQHLKHMGQQQQAGNQVDQHIERVDQRLVQIAQHYSPKNQGQCLTQPPEHLHISAFSLFFERTLTACTSKAP